MDFVLVLPLILAFISSGQSHTEVTEQATNSCYKLCPADDERVISPCSTISDVVCDCKEGYYNGGSNLGVKLCKPCKCQNCKEPIDNDDYKKKCLPCQREVAKGGRWEGDLTALPVSFTISLKTQKNCQF
ncbi:uncharacterized protein AKAME5_002549100 [Lates japonicus]|uniref:Uncharacterized protein n=1 Tax=Lates japonicus TaxID=270547 RepID=A0AAD3RM47_LATJO|nr:uncharacterized protein AKAME5_002549100 [Lates japonicus]